MIQTKLSQVMENTELKSKIEAIGHEKAATFMGCIYVNYLVWMNGGLQGYSHKALQQCEEKQRQIAINTPFNELVNAIIAGIQQTPETVTQQYYQQAYKSWFVK